MNQHLVTAKVVITLLACSASSLGRAAANPPLPANSPLLPADSPPMPATDNPPIPATDSPPIPATSLGIFHDFWSNTAQSFGGENFLFHAAAFGSTFVLSSSGADTVVQRYFQTDPIGGGFGLAATITGYGLQPLLGGILLLIPDNETKTAGAAVLQAAIVQLAYVTMLKGLTGRPDPIAGGDPNNIHVGLCSSSLDGRDFFLLLQGCTWPSGHTASAFSLVSALYAFYPEKTWIALVGYPVAVLIGIGMVEADEHWLSDVIGGALIGHVIGWTIGSNFRNDFDPANKRGPAQLTHNHDIRPVLSSTGVGLSYSFEF